jgi:hypothetical protein
MGTCQRRSGGADQIGFQQYRGARRKRGADTTRQDSLQNTLQRPTLIFVTTSEKNRRERGHKEKEGKKHSLKIEKASHTRVDRLFPRREEMLYLKHNTCHTSI